MAIQNWPCTEHPDSSPTPGRNRCRQCVREYNRDYRAVRIAAKDPAWYEYRRRTTNAYTARLRANALAAIGELRCACCDIDRLVFLSIDHIDDDGHSHREQHANQQQLYRSIIADPDSASKYQILCHNCNMAKAMESNHTCPRER